MSFDAITFAFAQKLPSSTLKLVLLALADCAHRVTGRIHPSVAHLVEKTHLNRKTVLKSIARLEELGLIRDTGQRVGKTRQIRVFELTEGRGANSASFDGGKEPTFSSEPSQIGDTEPGLEPIPLLQVSNETCSPSLDDKVVRPEHLVEAWNVLADKIGRPKVRGITPERRKRLRSIVKTYCLEEILEVLDKVERSSFLRGDRNWAGCSFDWVFRKGNFQKVLEGNYDE